jgi:hypothetical protein
MVRLISFSVLLFAAAGIFALASENAPPVLTVCEVLSDLQRYDGQSVVVVGRSSFTEEGSWLDEECGLKVVNDGREFPASISTAYAASEFAAPPPKPSGFRWNKRILQQKLETVQRTTHLRVLKDINYSDQWLCVFGRLETRLPRQVSFGYTNGFGHLSAAPAQLISPKDGFLRLRAK